MNFIESLFEEMNRTIKEISGDIPKKIQSYCIGSGSNFKVHAYITYRKATQIYEEMKNNLQCLGKRTDYKNVNGFTKETFRTMESQTGYTTTFMFPISNIEIHNPNETIYEWTETLEKQTELRNQFKKWLSNKKQNEKI